MNMSNRLQESRKQVANLLTKLTTKMNPFFCNSKAAQKSRNTFFLRCKRRCACAYSKNVACWTVQNQTTGFQTNEDDVDVMRWWVFCEIIIYNMNHDRIPHHQHSAQKEWIIIDGKENCPLDSPQFWNAFYFCFFSGWQTKFRSDFLLIFIINYLVIRNVVQILFGQNY